MEHGLLESSHYQPKSGLSEDPNLEASVSGAEEFEAVSASELPRGDGDAGGSPSSNGAEPLLKPPSRTSPESSESDWETLDPGVLDEGAEGKAPAVPITVQPLGGQGAVAQGLLSGLEEDQYGMPLAIFTKVNAHWLIRAYVLIPLRGEGLKCRVSGF